MYLIHHLSVGCILTPGKCGLDKFCNFDYDFCDSCPETGSRCPWIESDGGQECKSSCKGKSSKLYRNMRLNHDVYH